MRGSAVFRTGIAPGGALAGPWVRNPLWTRARAVPSLDLRFADNKSLVDATTGASLVTFTRASTGTYVGSDGVLRSATTNLLLQSEDFSTTWIKDSNAVVTTNVATAPNGSVTADKFAVGTSTFPQIAQAATSTVSLTHSFSVYIKAAGLNFIQLRVRNAGASTNYFRAVFNLSTGAVTSAITNGTGVIVSATTVNAGDGWWRCTLTGIADTTGTSIQPLAILATDASGTLATSSNSAATDGVLLWGAQLEQSSTVGEYIPTTSTINSAPRFDHNPTTGESLGLLVEEARTNLFLQSEAWDTSPWTSTAPYSVTANAIASPDGAQTADALIVASGQSSFNTNVTRQVITKAASAIQYTRSAYFKTLGSTTSVRINDFSTSSANGASAVVSLVDGSIITAPSVAGTFSGASVAVSNAGNGWWRVAFTYTTDTTTSLTIRSFPYVGANVLTGDGSSGLYVWGAQLEAGAFPTSYIPTTTATVTRAADVASITGTNFSSWYNQTEGTVFASMSALAVAPVTALQPLYAIHDGSTDNRIALYKRSNADVSTRLDIAVAAVNQAFINAGTFTLNNVSAVAIQINNFAVSLNGLTALSDTSGNVPVVTQITLGQYVNATAFLNGHIKRLTYWPVRLGNNVLQQITQ